MTLVAGLRPDAELGPVQRGCDGVPRRRVPPTPELDGLRGLAIAAVALFHYPTHSVFVGGLFGVGLFFVLSGFLVTPILTSEHSRTGRVALRQFLAKRAWRLLPALLVFVAVLVVMTAAFGHTGWFASNPFAGPGPGPPVALPDAAKGALATLTYSYNFFLAHNVTMPKPFGHMWTLAVEGQFYVGWALVVPRLLRRGMRLVMAVTVALIAVSALVPFLVWDDGRHQSWIYFSTVPRLQELLAGAVLAQIWAAGVLRRLPVALVRAAAAVGGAVFAYMVVEVGNTPFKYLGALTVVALCGVLIIPYLVDRRCSGWAKRLLASRPAVWLGTRSYAVYLWHWPLAEWTNRLPHSFGVPLGLGATLAAAELSWRLVEVPAQRLRRRRHAAA